jgi:peptidoglycan hydrolase CwlO-like protein
MKRRNIVITIFLVVLSISFLFGLSRYYEEPVIADDGCPLYMTPDQCLDYLEQQLEELADQKTDVQNKLEDEEYQQLTLEEKINYINGQIAHTENEISTLEVKIAKHNVEINILEENISKMEDDIAVLGQEISVLESSVSKRITESYKYSFVGPLELFLDTHNLSSLLRKTKYLAITRTQDRESLEVYNNKVVEIKEEETKLSEERATLLETRNTLETEKIELAIKKEDLNAQRTERERLLAESKEKEKILASELAALTKKSNEVTAKITTLLLQQFRSGQIPLNTEVKAGDIIGFQGHTGFAYGSHLHLNWQGSGGGPLELGYFRIDSGRVYGNKAVSPLGDGAYLTQGYHAGYSLDMVGLYNWNYEKYTVGYKEVCCGYPFQYLGCVPAGSYNLNGEGTPVRAIKDGVVTKVQIDPCGGKYVIVDHGNGETTLYLHLR